jgi:heme/copper-type cytochrome/quinol oxidase subunit 2
MKTRLLFAVALMAMVIGYAALPALSADAPKPFVADRAAKEVTIEMKAYKYAYDPGDITVYEGQKVTFVITATDRKHGFKLDAYNINVTLPQGEPTTVTFVADKVGEFPFKCSVFCGPGHFNMKGVLKVVKP